MVCSRMKFGREFQTLGLSSGKGRNRTLKMQEWKTWEFKMLEKTAASMESQYGKPSVFLERRG